MRSLQPGEGQKIASDIIMAQVLAHSEGDRHINPFNFLHADIERVFSNKGRMASHESAPIQIVRDLEKTHGKTVEVDIAHKLVKLPRVGDQDGEGRGEKVTTSNFEVRIGYNRKIVDHGGVWAQQDRGYEIIAVGKKLAETYWHQYESERTMYHIMGDRGTFMREDMIIPVADLNTTMRPYMVNAVQAPTFKRHFYAGGANSIDGTTGNAIQNGDLFGMEFIEDLRAKLVTMAHPPQRCTFGGPTALYPVFITPQMRMDFQRDNSRMYQQLAAQALARSKDLSHPIFSCPGIMYEDMYFTEYYRPMQWLTGESILVNDDNLNGVPHVEIVPGGIPAIHRGVVMGAQMLTMGMGSTAPGLAFETWDGKKDNDTKSESEVRWCNGSRVTLFRDQMGRLYEHGRLTFDCAVSEAAAA